MCSHRKRARFKQQRDSFYGLTCKLELMKDWSIHYKKKDELGAPLKTLYDTGGH